MTDTRTYRTAWGTALAYATLVLLLGASQLPSMSGDDITIKRIIGVSSLFLMGALLPLAALWLGHRFKSETARWIVQCAVIFACTALPMLMFAMVLSSVEPLAALAVLYVPPTQAVMFVLALLIAALAKRG
jgi:peptidoglycan/LPS O-acetylase OafA/YrhL